MVGIRPRPPLDDVECVAMRIRVFIDPNSFVFESDRVDHQSIAFPTAKLLPEKGRIGIFRMLTVGINWNEPVVSVEVKERDLSVSLQDFKG